jgi:thiamine kinase-like enzyme
MNQDQTQNFNTFTNPDGSDSRKEEKIDIAQLSIQLEHIGIKAIDLTQLWRNVTGKVKYEGKIRFFKMASTEGISQKLENEVLWNNFANSSLQSSSLFVPKIIKSGRLDGLSFYISEFVDGRPLATKWEGGKLNPKIYNLKKYLPEISDFAANLQNANQLTITNVDNQISSISSERTLLEGAKKILLGKIKSWIQPENIIDTDLKVMFSLVENNICNWKFCINHADFVPWHILETKGGQLYLIDGEHASLKPCFYDIAYFYHRTFTQAERPDLAEEFLQLTFSKLNPEKKALFNQQFPSVLASRIIGGYFDAVSDKQEDLSFHNRLTSFWEDKKM